jgi:CheY-like chemotaxis protein
MATGQRSRRVLIVEDDRTNREALGRLLKHVGCQIEVASTLAEGLAKLEAAPDCVLVDFSLPDGSGANLVAAVRSGKLKTAVAVVTGSVEASDVSLLENLGPDAVFTKPVRPDELLGWVMNVTEAA